ncbi:MAG: hypothetical protein M1830_000447 [Pleopsidium flavum]|nr:MAG: hypothetical protein M1830_000447 [Pleopsidium flavum]
MQSPSNTLEPIVYSLVQKYQTVEDLNPLLQTLFRSAPQKDLFTTVAQYDYDVLKSRSQNLAHHEINAYQKAYCILMENEDDRIGGLEIYVEKILGIDQVEDGDKEEWLAKGVAVRALLAHVSQPSLSPSPSNITAQQPHVTFPSSPTPTALKTPNPTDTEDAKLTKLYKTYRTARSDFLSIPTTSTKPSPNTNSPNLFNPSATTSLHQTERTKAAKFLRDTIENLIQYLKTQDHSSSAQGSKDSKRHREEMVEELGLTLRVAKQVAEEGSGGRKRRFDLGVLGGGGVPLGPKRVRGAGGRRGGEEVVRGGGVRGGRGGGYGSVRGSHIGGRSLHPLRLALPQSQSDVVHRRGGMTDDDVWRSSQK